MKNKVTPRYSSITCIIPIDLHDKFLSECEEYGINAGKVEYFSTGRFDEFLNIIYDRWEEYAPKILMVLSKFKSKNKINIDVSADRKKINLEGISVEDALRLIKAADCIEVTHSNSTQEEKSN
ncbi:hypothetical protein [Ewingella americana]|uniref:hypothetical protein n=1 Tax=Ewingella americana TaxID=41202 RepID=UPI0012AD5C53|nr:hypothetical protein [Ewingella americana]MRT04067.1 hypothetical protein [Ewingella americana]